MDGETPLGELLLKLMMHRSVIDKRATSTYLRENLTNLDTHMSTEILSVYEGERGRVKSKG